MSFFTLAQPNGFGATPPLQNADSDARMGSTTTAALPPLGPFAQLERAARSPRVFLASKQGARGDSSW